jgi:putative heme iron utilization protein
MDDTQAKAICDLLRAQPIGALGTLHAGDPFVSMAPFAILPDGSGFVLHVSRLATHTKDMMTSANVQAVARITILGTAKQCVEPNPVHSDAKTAYLSRFPESAPMFGFADFSLFVIEPASARFVGGFAQATSLSSETLKRILSAA